MKINLFEIIITRSCFKLLEVIGSNFKDKKEHTYLLYYKPKLKKEEYRA